MTNPLRKPRTDSTLDSLPPEQQRRILDWLSSHTYVAVLDKIAVPALEGLGIKIHYPSLKRFDAAATNGVNSIDDFFMKLLKSATDLPKVKTNPPVNDQNTPINANSDTIKHPMPHLTGI